jgi:hypothetical protein
MNPHKLTCDFFTEPEGKIMYGRIMAQKPLVAAHGADLFAYVRLYSDNLFSMSRSLDGERIRRPAWKRGGTGEDEDEGEDVDGDFFGCRLAGFLRRILAPRMWFRGEA